MLFAGRYATHFTTDELKSLFYRLSFLCRRHVLSLSTQVLSYIKGVLEFRTSRIKPEEIGTEAFQTIFIHDLLVQSIVWLINNGKKSPSAGLFCSLRGYWDFFRKEIDERMISISKSINPHCNIVKLKNDEGISNMFYSRKSYLRWLSPFHFTANLFLFVQRSKWGDNLNRMDVVV